MATVPRKELAKRIGDKLGMRDADVMRVMQMFLDTIVDGLAVGDRFELRDFGVFEVIGRKAKKARNPKTGEEVTIPARKVVRFKNGRIMKEKLGGATEGGSPITG